MEKYIQNNRLARATLTATDELNFQKAPPCEDSLFSLLSLW
jgi:hypothetical protein